MAESAQTGMPHGAVFLSYASQDAEAAKRICEALRAAGIEVWFDRSDLRGGEAWDQSIRKQIKECVLFMPIVSANTQAREEGYFRLEWRLADQRTHLLGRSRPFLVPVCIDGIRAGATFTLVRLMLVAIAGLGLLLAAAGIYGVIANLVSEQTHEIGNSIASTGSVEARSFRHFRHEKAAVGDRSKTRE